MLPEHSGPPNPSKQSQWPVIVLQLPLLEHDELPGHEISFKNIYRIINII